jgi:hypothetical protein
MATALYTDNEHRNRIAPQQEWNLEGSLPWKAHLATPKRKSNLEAEF